MAKIIVLVLLQLLIIFQIRIDQVSAACNGNPTYCIGPCGQISSICSCINQSCSWETPLELYNCNFPDGTYCGYKDAYSCNTCWYCTQGVNTTDSCTNLGYYLSTCYTGDCPSSPGPTSTPTPPPPTIGQPTCSVDTSPNGINYSDSNYSYGTTISVFLSANANDPSAPAHTANLWITRRDGAAFTVITPEPMGTVTNESGGNKMYFYLLSSTTTQNTAQSTTINLQVPPGEYYLGCHVVNSSPSEPLPWLQCSGNPFCTFNYDTSPRPSLPQYDCGSSWQSCSKRDNHYFVVNQPTTAITANLYDNTGLAGCTSTTLVPFPQHLVNLTGKTSSADNPAVFTNVTSTPGTTAILSVTNTPIEWLPSDGCGGTNYAINFTDANYNVPVTHNFYFTHRADAWWQAAGGDVYAAAGATNTVPATATSPYTVTNLLGQANSSGAIIAGTTNSVNNVGPAGREWSVNNSAVQSTSQKYGYFVSLLEVSNPTDGWTPDALAAIDSTHPLDTVAPTKTYDPPDNNQVYYHHGDLNIDDLTIGSGQAVTLLVDGNLTVNTNITVASGGFFAAIVTGNITIAENVTKVHGIYIADGRLTIKNANNSLVGSNRQFVGEGVFVGWSGVALNRKLNVSPTDTYENTNPAVIFKYRPDFIINAPESFKHSTIKWTEVAPR